MAWWCCCSGDTTISEAVSGQAFYPDFIDSYEIGFGGGPPDIWVGGFEILAIGENIRSRASTVVWSSPLAIPNAATIASAKIVGTAPWWGSTPSPVWPGAAVSADITIAGHDVDDSSERFTLNGQAKDAARTTATVAWTPAQDAYAAGSTVTSPDFATVVKEIVDRPGWASGNLMRIFFDENAGGGPNYSLRVFLDDSSLVIEYS